MRDWQTENELIRLERTLGEALEWADKLAQSLSGAWSVIPRSTFNTDGVYRLLVDYQDWRNRQEDV